METKKIIEIEIISNEDVYDITVEDNHNFLANGTLVHNCVEIGMYAYDDEGNSGWSFCNLCEMNPKKAKTADDFYKMCEYASIIGTLQAGYTDFDYLGPITEKIVRREALLGVSMTGIMDNPTIALNPDILKEGAKIIKNVNKEVAKILGINQAARTTCVKPAGCHTTDTIIKTNKGDMSYYELFKLAGYDLNELNNESNKWLEIPKNFDVKIYNENNVTENISRLYINGKSKYYEIPMEDGTIFRCTPNHKFKLKNGNWVQAKDLKIGDDILNF